MLFFLFRFPINSKTVQHKPQAFNRKHTDTQTGTAVLTVPLGCRLLGISWAGESS